MKQESKKDTWKIIAIIFIFLFVLLAVLFVSITSGLISDKEYYKEATLDFCEISKSAVNIILIQDPTLESEIEDIGDCDYYILEWDK